MTIRRRDILHAAAVSPAIVLLPSLSRAASAAAPLVEPGSTITGVGIDGLSLSWQGPVDGPVAVVDALRDGAWRQVASVVADRGHGPTDPTGREHGPLVLVPGADSYRVHPTGAATDLRQHVLESERQLDAQGLVPDPEELTFVEPLAGLEIIERKNWTFRSRLAPYDCPLSSSLFDGQCKSDVGLRHGVVHHTVNVNDYTEQDVPELLRGIQRYHMDTRAWTDIGYNFVIDRFGRIWHARQADIYLPITSGHTTGLNAESLGVAVLGTFTEADPGDAVIESLGRLLGWKLSLHGVDPLGMTEVRSTGGDLAEKGDVVLLHNISGHRDHQFTSCPGTLLYDRIAEVRSTAADFVPIFGVLRPTYALESVGIDGWVVERADPSAILEVDVTLDGEALTTLSADGEVTDLLDDRPEEAQDHGFSLEIPIDLDTWSITATARASDDRTTSLMDLKLFAGFIDVEPDRFFAEPIYWMRVHDLTRGTAAGLFEPMDRISRAQMAAFLHRFMGAAKPDDEADFEDVERPSWYSTAVDWMAQSGITLGLTPTTFGPDAFVTRGQMATFLWRMCGEDDAPDPPFTDLEQGRFYVPGVAWLHEHAITTGTTADTFTPEGTLTRGEMATFLHRLALDASAWDIVDPPPIVVATQAAL